MTESKIGRIMRYRDFRLLWIGAFISFTGGWVQNVAQGYFVYQLTGEESKLAMVSFFWSLPVLLFGLVAGTFADTFDKRKVMVVTQCLLACGSAFLAVATFGGFVQYWHVVAVAFFLGTVSSVEMPTRQSIVSRVVPAEELAAAVPVNAMTFNVARIVGPAIGGLLLARFGVPWCYLLNTFTFIALIFSTLKIKSDLSARPREAQPLMDLVLEGMLYTMRDRRLRTLFLLEAITASFGIVYMPLLPAFVEQILRMNKVDAKGALGLCYTFVGIGAFAGLILVTTLSDRPWKAKIIRIAMWTISVCLVILSVARSLWVAFPCLALLGACTVAQFNTTNALFQILSPDKLRGRVLAMHIWGLNGLSPFGILFFGWLANETRLHPFFHFRGELHYLTTTGVALAYQGAAACVVVGALAASLSRKGLLGLEA